MDSIHLTRVLSSLLENGLQNASTHGEVQLSFDEEPESILIQVCDNGRPFPEDICASLFSRAGRATSEPQASQLPLQFCRIAIENCQGEIAYESRKEGGNCFLIRLPKSAATK